MSLSVTSMNTNELIEFMDVFKLNNKKVTISFPSVIVYENGNIYKGEITPKENIANGYGEMLFANGDVMAIKWKNNLANGCGIYIYANGTEIRGIWVNGVLSSTLRSKLTFINGDIYNGPFVNCEMNGLGTYFTAEDGEEFTGNFVNGFRVGYGISEWKNGSVYKGNWANNTFDGIGTLLTPNKIYTGPWYNGIQQSNGLIINIIDF